MEMLRFIHGNIKIVGEWYEVKSNRGLPQGLTSSPQLFNIYIDDLAR
jgi:hypothetical protein